MISSSLDLPLKGRHDVLVAGHDLGARVQDRLAEVVLVGDDRLLPSRRWTGLPYSSSSTGARAFSSALWQLRQRYLRKTLRPCRASDPSACDCEPVLIVGRLHARRPCRSCRRGSCRNTASRTGDKCPAASPGTRPTCSGRAARPCARGNAGTKKLWITSSEVSSSLTGRPTGTCSVVDLALPFGMLELPHPLLADDVDRRGVVRGAIGVEVDVRPPDEHDHEDAQRRQRPEPFQQLRRRAFPAAGAVCPGGADSARRSRSAGRPPAGRPRRRRPSGNRATGRRRTAVVEACCGKQWRCRRTWSAPVVMRRLRSASQVGLVDRQLVSPEACSAAVAPCGHAAHQATNSTPDRPASARRPARTKFMIAGAVFALGRVVVKAEQQDLVDRRADLVATPRPGPAADRGRNS